MDHPQLKLKKNEDKRLRSGHLWIFSNEVDTKATPLSAFTPGEIVTVTDHHSKPLANAYINPHSLICARIFSFNLQQHLDQDFFQNRINQALSLRERYFTKPFYRLLFSEADLAPGLIIDRFDNAYVIQISTLGMEQRLPEIIAALEVCLTPDTIVVNNQTGIRQLEGLECYTKIARGTPGDNLEVFENDCRFLFPTLQGQKTGWFYDHRLNRLAFTRWVTQAQVLDVFSYLGAWGIQALVSGAKHATCIDSSASACEYINMNAELNNVASNLSVIHNDAFEALNQLKQQEQKFDVVVLDPPAFIKRKKDQQQGTVAYQRLNKLAMQLLNTNGILVSASCSFHFSREQHIKVLAASAQQAHKPVQIIHEGGLGPDHPTHPAIPETNYLSCFSLRLLND